MFSFDTARSATQHAGAVRERIHQLKFGAQLHWAPPLAELLHETFGRHRPPEIDFIIPVPLHVRRLRQRGFNQSGLIARSFARRVGLPARFDVLVRKTWTEPQTRLNRQQRLQNVKNAFAVARPGEVRGSSILLIDDVFTTGTTIEECSRTLRKAGATGVHALTVSRALPDWKPGPGRL